MSARFVTALAVTLAVSLASVSARPAAQTTSCCGPISAEARKLLEVLDATNV